MYVNQHFLESNKFRLNRFNNVLILRRYVIGKFLLTSDHLEALVLMRKTQNWHYVVFLPECIEINGTNDRSKYLNSGAEALEYTE
jgi:hypothetical protein